MTFMITAAQNYNEVFTDVTTLMERISAFFKRLDVYMSNSNTEVKLDKRLRPTVYKVLEHFVTIMGMVYKNTKGRKAKIKLVGKIAFLDDDGGIKASLTALETLVVEVTRTEITVIVSELSEAARNIRDVERKLDELGHAAEKTVAYTERLVVAEDTKSAIEREAKDLEMVQKTLNIDRSKRSWDRQMDLWEGQVSGTGTWLLEKSVFLQWADLNSVEIPILTIRAPSGFGKSYLSSIVVRHLQDQFRDDPQVSVAYYYFENESGEKSSRFNRAIKTVIWQLAQANSGGYAKHAAKACESVHDSSRASSYWKSLITVSIFP